MTAPLVDIAELASRTGAHGFGPKIRAARTAAGRSQSSLAASADISPSALFLAEQGIAPPGLPAVIAIAEALGTTPCDLWGAA